MQLASARQPEARAPLSNTNQDGARVANGQAVIGLRADAVPPPRAPQSSRMAPSKMAFAGITKESEIDNLWAFLAQFDKDGKIKK